MDEADGVPGERALANPGPPNLLFTRAGTSAVSPNGQHLCVAADGNQSAIDAGIPGSDQILPTLYWLSADGSGARLISSSEGASNPCFAPDGSALLYDAPLNNATGDNQNIASARRTLWVGTDAARAAHSRAAGRARRQKRSSTRSGTSPWQDIEIVGDGFRHRRRCATGQARMGRRQRTHKLEQLHQRARSRALFNARGVAYAR
jgi:hypothetical protein